jgi:hypothetical protein
MAAVPTPSPVKVTIGFVPNPLPAIAKVVVAPAFHESGVIDPMLGVGSPTLTLLVLLVPAFVVTVMPYWPVLLGLLPTE